MSKGRRPIKRGQRPSVNHKPHTASQTPGRKKRGSPAKRMWRRLSQDEGGMKTSIAAYAPRAISMGKERFVGAGKGPKRQGYVDRYISSGPLTSKFGSSQIIYEPKKDKEYYKARLSAASTESLNRRAREAVKKETERRYPGGKYTYFAPKSYKGKKK